MVGATIPEVQPLVDQSRDEVFRVEVPLLAKLVEAETFQRQSLARVVVADSAGQGGITLFLGQVIRSSACRIISFRNSL